MRIKRHFVLMGFGLKLGLIGAIAACNSLPNAYEARLADHLTESGAKMYGAYWCPHCATQKEYFGGAVSRIPYVECDPEGFDAQPELCQEMGIDVYPTWIIEDEYYFGSQALGKLAKLSGFEGESADADNEADPVPSGGFSPAN
ncbi:MAG: hypothetical protein AAFY72_06315 [Cyanobacteria bacterium J06649_4]